MKDYCTLWPDWIGDIWIGGCCKAHDYAYFNGLPRLEADRELEACVTNLGLPLTGLIMGLAVTLLGFPFWLRAKRRKR